jgi:PAS domain S-box-containing protein
MDPALSVGPPTNENAADLAASRGLDQLDSSSRVALDAVVALASHLCEARVAVVSRLGALPPWHVASSGTDAQVIEWSRAIGMPGDDETDVAVIPDTIADRSGEAPAALHAPRSVGAFAAAPLRSPDGDVLGTLCVFAAEPQDFPESQRQVLRMLAGYVESVLQQRALQRQLATERTRLAETQSVAGVGSWETDLVTRHVTWSQETHRIFGTDPALFRPTHDAFLALVHPEDRAAVDAAFVASLGNTLSHEIEHRIVRPDGDERRVQERWRVYVDADGTALRAVGTSHDVTDRRSFEQQLFRSQRLESLGTLAGGIAHDLNNVLAPIMLSVDLLSTDLAVSEQRELLETIKASAKRGADMVRQVLTFARGVDGARVAVSGAAVVRAVLRIARDTFPKNITIHAHVDDANPSILGDATQLEQVLLNLCVNARDAMPDGGELRVAVGQVVVDEQFIATTPDARPGPHLVIDVEDTGVGMTAVVLERIFDPFFTTKPPGKGTGLGLSSSLAIIRGHGGFAHVYSEPGRGSRFRIFLPIANDRSVDDAARAGTGTADRPRSAGELILVVDDEPAVRSVTRRTLEAAGYAVLTATDGADAVAQFASHRDRIALVITDIMMPIMDGATLSEILVRMDPLVRIIAVSGLQANAEPLRGHVRQFLAKPFTAETLLDTVHRVLHPGRTSLPIRPPV